VFSPEPGRSASIRQSPARIWSAAAAAAAATLALALAAAPLLSDGQAKTRGGPVLALIDTNCAGPYSQRFTSALSDRLSDELATGLSGVVIVERGRAPATVRSGEPYLNVSIDYGPADGATRVTARLAQARAGEFAPLGAFELPNSVVVGDHRAADEVARAIARKLGIALKA